MGEVGTLPYRTRVRAFMGFMQEGWARYGVFDASFPETWRACALLLPLDPRRRIQPAGLRTCKQLRLAGMFIP
jgi:hypothetical protein